ncbi:hypothetical protein BKA62DRAFT_673716 [Auriculariales sp. MPI-PUGE-AT-0066]|nr:hypothetical protein BKA62DRAFT_673716 [Auriculariales sp. MPI-PUGE-AT-0066]
MSNYYARGQLDSHALQPGAPNIITTNGILLGLLLLGGVLLTVVAGRVATDVNLGSILGVAATCRRGMESVGRLVVSPSNGAQGSSSYVGGVVREFDSLAGISLPRAPLVMPDYARAVVSMVVEIDI